MDFKIIHLDETDSTNRWLMSQCTASQAADRSVSDVINEQPVCVVADYQTAGRGCGSNAWESERGSNLTFSVLLHPVGILADRQFVISEIVSVALCRVLDTYLHDNEVEIKWPNDIYYGDRKLCGILIENRLRSRIIKDSVIGIGINVNQEVFRSDAPNPVSLRQILGKTVNCDKLLQAFLHQLILTMSSETVSNDYRSRLYRRIGMHSYQDSKGVFSAELSDVLDDGRLVLIDEDGVARIYSFKEVSYIINS